jgi:hypothetical protein
MEWLAYSPDVMEYEFFLGSCITEQVHKPKQGITHSLRNKIQDILNKITFGCLSKSEKCTGRITKCVDNTGAYIRHYFI